MQDTRHVPNPLRPYYVPPSIGAQGVPNATTGISPTPVDPPFSFPDLDYSDYLADGPSSVPRLLKSLLDQAFWKYTSVAFAQPFEVAKLILQTRLAQDDAEEPAPRDVGEGNDNHDDEFGHRDDEAHSSDEEPNFFTSQGPYERPFATRSPPRGRRGRPPTRARARAQASDGRIHIKNPHSLLDALSALSAASGALTMWRATNTTFVYLVLSRTLETFCRSFLAALFGVAENDVMVPITSGAIPDASVLASTTPAATIFITTAAAAISSLVLAPIDTARTRLILTPSNQEPRTLLGTLRTLPTAYLIPQHLIPITFLTTTLPTAVSTSLPVFLRSYLGLDPVVHSASWSVATFLGSALDLSIKYPLETVLRRAQIATWAPTAPATSAKGATMTTIVPVPQSYKGVLPTMWSIARDEGYSESQKDRTAALMGKAPRRKRKGQGLEGLYRGWRFGFWGLVGVWGTSFVGGLQFNGDSVTSNPGIHGGKF